MADDKEKLTQPERRFAEQVRKLREDRGWSQSELADQMIGEGISYANASTISRIESAVRPVRMIEAQALSRLFKRTVEGMMHPDGREAFVEIFGANDMRRRMEFAHFKEAAHDLGRAQVYTFDEIAELKRLFSEGSIDDPQLRSRYEHVLANLEQFAAIDLEAEAADTIRAARSQSAVRE
jgi:transcriptional regulator with XRE-family HTH domain